MLPVLLIDSVLPHEQLGGINEPILIDADADANFRPMTAQNILPVAAAAHEGGFGLFHIGMVRNIFSNALIGIAEIRKHGGSVAVSGGGVGEVMIGMHIIGFDPGNAGKLAVQGQSGQSVGCPVLIKQIQ